MTTLPEGYTRPLHTSLTRPVLLGGVPRTFAILNLTVGAAIAFGLQQPLVGLPLAAVLQAGAAWAAHRDPWFLETWPRSLTKPPFLDA